jgi:O-antigen ligase
MRAWRPWAERAYAVAMLALLTQGPVLKAWEGSALVRADEIPTARWITYALAQIPAAALLLRRGLRREEWRGPIGLLLGFAGWMLASTVWATLASHTVIEATSLALTTLAGVWFALRFRLVEQLAIVCVAMQPGVLLSWWAVREGWSGARHPDAGYWIGIYFNRNSLAPPAAVGALAALGLLWIVAVRRPRPWWPALAAWLAVAAAIDVGTLLRSRSRTAWGAIAAFVVMWVAWTALRQVRRWGLLDGDRLRRVVVPAYLAVAASMVWAFFWLQHRTAVGVGDDTLSGRAVMWRYSWDGVARKPLLGWGWLSAWHTELFFKENSLSPYTIGCDVLANCTRWSHSAYMDVLLGGGAIAAAALLVVVVWSALRSAPLALGETAGQWIPATTWFVLAAGTQETFFVGHHFLWLLLVAALSAGRGAPASAPADPPARPRPSDDRGA